MKTIRIDIADDHKMVLAGLKNILEAFPHIRVSNLYEGGARLIEGMARRQPDVLLLDIQMPDVSGEELTPLILKAYPAVRILVMTGFDTTHHARRMLELGASGYLLKNASETSLREAIETVYRGAQYIDEAIKNKLVAEWMQPRRMTPVIPALTRREKEILRLIMQEYTSQQIAGSLNLSLRTVENQRVNLMQKMNVKNAVGLVKKTLEWKLLE